MERVGGVRSGDVGSCGDDLVDPELELGGVHEAGEDCGAGGTTGEEGHPALDLGGKGPSLSHFTLHVQGRFDHEQQD